jgi:lactoylglutathione lyase
MQARLLEIELRVADVERSLRFYRDLVGVPIGDLETHESDTESHAHATWGQWKSGETTLLMLNIYPASAEKTRTRIGFSVPDLDAAHDRLRAAGTHILQAPVMQPWGRTASYVDPDGNTVSLTEAPREGTNLSF